ncbi:MAG: alpha-galactosidase [Clostridia bacterium]|nr:alpha-galactosidase [Clostridia bacterium]
MNQCYMKVEKGCLLFGNQLWERAIQIDGDRPMSLSVTDKKTGKIWKGSQPVSLFCLSEETYVCTVHSREWGQDGLRIVLQCMGQNHIAEMTFLLFDGSPFFSSRLFVRGCYQPQKSEEQAAADGNENAVIIKSWDRDILCEQDSVEAFGLSDRHLQVKITALRDVTDRYNHLVTSDEEWMYTFGRQNYRGDFFQFTNPLDHTGFTVVKEAPCRGARLNGSGADVVVYPGNYLCVRGSGLDDSVLDQEGDGCYGTAIGLCSGEEALREYKRFYQRVCGPETYVMSNTWGDRNQDAAVCDAFIRQEIDRAAELGVDVVQIDDGWQKGTTSNSKLAKSNAWGSYYDAMPDFWAVNQTKFPNGLEPVCAYAKEKGVKIGLWFSPDSTNSYSQWQKDAETLISLHRRLGVRYFKLDGVNLAEKSGDRNLRRMVETVYRETDGAVDFNFDITAQVRWGYCYQKQYGKLFLENRYTDWGNYFPHDTLRNLWEVSRYVPAQRLQIEVLNPRRNKEKYPEDPFAPDLYAMDYLFGIAMAANPLIWMEMSSLSEEDCWVLKDAISLYRTYRDKLQRALVSPIGQKPSGMSFTGFLAELEQEGFLLVFREMTEEDSFLYPVEGSFEVLYGDVAVKQEKGGVRVSFAQPRCFGLLHYNKK